ESGRAHAPTARRTAAADDSPHCAGPHRPENRASANRIDNARAASARGCSRQSTDQFEVVGKEVGHFSDAGSTWQFDPSLIFERAARSTVVIIGSADTRRTGLCTARLICGWLGSSRSPLAVRSVFLYRI